MDQSIERKIESVDWASFTGPDLYDPVKVAEALVHLSRYDETRAKHGLDKKVLCAIGNNHRGTYYPALLVAVDILVEIEKSGAHDLSKRCAYAILNDLYYLNPNWALMRSLQKKK